MKDLNAFLTRLFSELATVGLDVSKYEADHVCYRVATMAEYEKGKAIWLTRGALLHEAKISGRLIATFALSEPIVYQTWKIRLVELPAPKQGSPYDTGWEHAEFVVPEGLPALMKKHRKLKWDASGADKPLNPELRLSFGTISAKFHPLALDEVIRRERA